MSLYENLKKKHRFYCLGKRPSILKAACHYIEGLIDREKYRSQQDIAKEVDISEVALRKRAKEIVKLLGLETNNNFCEYCGKRVYLKILNRYQIKYCRDCREIKSLIKKWENASMCICCGELNPFILLTGDGHHLLGQDGGCNISIPICANCHELTKPRTRQGFFLFENWKSPESKFTEDNSKIYIPIE